MKTNMPLCFVGLLITAAWICSSYGKGASSSEKPTTAAKPVIIAWGGAPESSASAHLNRGDEWAKMQNYQEAVSEYRQAVTMEPSNADAHTSLVKTLTLLGQYRDAVSEISVLRTLQPNSSRVTDGSKMVEDAIIKSTTAYLNIPETVHSDNPLMDAVARDSRYDAAIFNIGLLQQVGGLASVTLLKSLMGNSSIVLAAKAESVLQQLAAGEVDGVLDTLLDSSNVDVRTRTAKRLWEQKKSKKAGMVLLDIASAQVATAAKRVNGSLPAQSVEAMNQGLGNISALGYDIAKAFYRKVLSSEQDYSWELLTAVVQKLSAARDADMKDLVVAILRSRVADASRIIGYSPTQESLQYLASIGDKTYVPNLKVVLGYYFPSGDQQYCPAVIGLLAQMDGNKWNAFHYRKMGNEDFRTIMDEIEAFQAGNSYGQKVIDDVAEDSSSINKLFEALGKKNMMAAYTWGGDTLRSDWVEVMEVDRLKIHASIMEGNSRNVLYVAELIFRASAAEDRPWVLTKAENLKSVGQKVGGSAQSFYQSGLEKLKIPDYDGAISDFNKSLLWKASDDETLEWRGFAKDAKGDHVGALADLNQSIQMSPNYNWNS